MGSVPGDLSEGGGQETGMVVRRRVECTAGM